MEKGTLSEILTALKDISTKLDSISTSASSVRGPVADPGPGWGGRGPIADPGPGWGGRGPIADPGPGWGGRGPVADPGPSWYWPHLQRRFIVRGPEGDPGPEFLLDKGRLAKIKVHQLDIAITEMEKQVEVLKLEQSLLREEYNIE